jgi:transcriptional regulator GlxA family with amidase domain
MHVAIHLPRLFSATIASAIAEGVQAADDVSCRESFTFEFLSLEKTATSRTGIQFPARTRPSRKMDLLFLLSGAKPDMPGSLKLLELEYPRAKDLITVAEEQRAMIAASCGAAYFLARSGMLDGKKATIGWWMKQEAPGQFPKTTWKTSRLVIRDDRIYTSGSAFAAIELLITVLSDMGYKRQERQVRKLMAMPPMCDFDIDKGTIEGAHQSEFEQELLRDLTGDLSQLNLSYLGSKLNLSQRTLSRRFLKELRKTPGTWIQDKRLEAARVLLERTGLTVSQVCYRIGYEDVASFSRTFTRKIGMTPREYRLHDVPGKTS